MPHLRPDLRTDTSRAFTAVWVSALVGTLLSPWALLSLRESLLRRTFERTDAVADAVDEVENRARTRTIAAWHALDDPVPAKRDRFAQAHADLSAALVLLDTALQEVPETRDEWNRFLEGFSARSGEIRRLVERRTPAAAVRGDDHVAAAAFDENSRARLRRILRIAFDARYAMVTRVDLQFVAFTVAAAALLCGGTVWVWRRRRRSARRWDLAARRLIAAAESIAAPGPAPELPRRHPETAALIDTFAAMSQRLRSHDDELRRSEERLKLAIEIAGLGVWQRDLITDRLEWSPICRDIFGFDATAELHRDDFFNRVHPDDRDRVRAAADAAANAGTDYDVEYRIVRPDGRVRRVFAKARIFRAPRGTPLRVEGVLLDITERQIAEERLRQGESRFRGIVENAYEGIWVVGPTGMTVYVNPRMAQMLGHGPDDMIGRNALDFVPPNRRDEARAALDRNCAGEREHGEYPLLRGDGTELWSFVSSGPLLDGSGKSVGAVRMVTDLTERRRMEDELRRLNADLLRRSTELARRSEEVEAFVYIVSHDLRAPLVNVDGFCRELRLSLEDLRAAAPALDEASRRIVDADMPESLAYIEAAVARFDKLLRGLLTLSRTGRADFHPEIVDMNDLVARVADSITRFCSDAGAEVVRLHLPRARCDSAGVEQVFSNLLENAVKYAVPDRRPRIEIGGRAGDDGYNEYWVRDNGLGIPVSARRRLFQVFQRFHPDTATGDGMGLALVKRIVDRHGGRLWCESEEGVGSVFRFTLPAPPSENRASVEPTVDGTPGRG